MRYFGWNNREIPMSSENLANLVKQRYREMVDRGADPQQWSFAWRTEANKGGFKSVDFLMREIVDTGKSFETGSHINQPKKEN